MDEKEKAVREAARAHHDAKMRLDALEMMRMNVAIGDVWSVEQPEAYEMAQAEEWRAYHRLLKAKSAYARG